MAKSAFKEKMSKKSTITIIFLKLQYLLRIRKERRDAFKPLQKLNQLFLTLSLGDLTIPPACV